MNKEGLRMNYLEMFVNNNGVLQLAQHKRDEEITFSRYDKDSGLVDFEETISPGDMVTILNWYRYQKEIGNTNLSF
jgi:hypothetical protein